MRKLAMAALTVLLTAGAARAQGPDTLTVEVKTAVDKGLENLAGLQNPTDGSWLMSGYTTAITAMCIDAFELHGHLPENGSDPFVDAVNLGFGFLLTKLQRVGITADADTNGNGFGIRAIDSGISETYATAMCLMAFADSQAFNTSATVGVEAGRKYTDIAQDMVDYLAFGQNDSGFPLGGWGYTANQGYADNDNTRWVVMALDAAEWDYGLVIPAFVRTELKIWVSNIQDGTTGVSYYSSPGMLPNLRKTAGLVSEFAFLGDGLSTPRMQLALGYIEANWASASVMNANTAGNTFAVQAMQRCASATWLGPMVGGLAWYEKPGVGSAPALVARQNADGSWPSFDGPAYDSPPLTTALAIAALQVMRMGVGRTSVAFTAFEDDVTDPPPEDVIVEETSRRLGPYYLSWTAAEISGATWLTINPAAGWDGTPMTLIASLSGLSTGSYSATVEIGDPKAANGPLMVDVTLDLYDRPVLDADPAPVQFTMLVDEASPQNQSVTVSDASGAAYPAVLSWTAAEVDPVSGWLGLTNTSGTNDEAMTLEADVAGLAAGNYATTVCITDPGALADLDVVVNLTVQSRPIISPAASVVYFVTTEGEGDPSPQSVQIDNSNVGVNPHPLSWTASEDVDADWLTITTASGVAGDSVQMSAQILSYAPGDHSVQVNVSDPDAEPTQDQFDAVLRVQSKPVIDLPDGNITIYGFVGVTDPAPVQVTVEDSASTAPNHIAMAWSAVENPDRTWLDITTSSGANGDSMTIEAYVSGQSAGTYGTSITVTDPNADSTANFTVTFEVQTRPMIDPDPTAITFNGKTFGGDPALQTITVNDANSGANAHPLSWTAAEGPDVPWLVLANASGGAGDAVTLSASLAGLTPGDYNTTIVITDDDAGNSPRNVGVTFHVDQGIPVEEADSFIGGAGCGGALLTPGGRPAAALCVPWVLLVAVALGRVLRPRRPVGRAVVERD